MKKDLICECGHDWNYHIVLTDHACDLMDCDCKKWRQI